MRCLSGLCSCSDIILRSEAGCIHEKKNLAQLAVAQQQPAGSSSSSIKAAESAAAQTEETGRPLHPALGSCLATSLFGWCSYKEPKASGAAPSIQAVSRQTKDGGLLRSKCSAPCQWRFQQS